MRLGKATFTAALIAVSYFITGWSLPGMPAAPSTPLGTSLTMAESAGHPRISITVVTEDGAEIPTLAVTLRAAEGRVLGQQPTTVQPGGRQATTVLVPEAGQYVIEITGLPLGWASYPGYPTRQPIDASRFDRETGVAAVTVKLRPEPQRPALGTQVGPPGHQHRLQAGDPAR